MYLLFTRWESGCLFLDTGPRRFVALWPNSYMHFPHPTHPRPSAPLTSLCSLARLSSCSICPTRAGARPSLLCLLWQPTNQWLCSEDPTSLSEWLAARRGRERKPGLQPRLDRCRQEDNPTRAHRLVSGAANGKGGNLCCRAYESG